MEFEWDEAKRATNLVKHRVDFTRGMRVFEGRILEIPDTRVEYGEQRVAAYGVVDGDVLCVIYTWRVPEDGSSAFERPDKMNDERITRVTLAQVRRMKDRTDLAHLRRLTDAEITKAAADDPDTFFPTAEMWRNAYVVMPVRKAAMTMRIDPDVLAFFKRQGKGYQTRINAVLRTYMLAHAKGAPKKRGGARKRAT